MGIYACGDPHRLGNRPPWVAEAGTPTFFHPVQMPKPLSDLRILPQRLENRVIRLGCQTRYGDELFIEGLENRVIRLGCQTSWTPWPIPSTLANRVICRGVQTLHRKSYALPRLGEPLSESHHAAR